MIKFSDRGRELGVISLCQNLSISEINKGCSRIITDNTNSFGLIVDPITAEQSPSTSIASVPEGAELGYISSEMGVVQVFHHRFDKGLV